MDLLQFLRNLAGGGQKPQLPANRQPGQVRRFPAMPGGGETEDNRITNGMVDRGQLPESRREIYPQQTVQGPRGQDPKNYGYAPEITFNPNPRTNIPYSTHNQADVALGNEYTADPTNSKFRGVDPKRFGYPEDIGQYGSAPQRPQLGVQNGSFIQDLLKRRY